MVRTIPSQVFLAGLKKELEELTLQQHCVFATTICERHKAAYFQFAQEVGWGDSIALSLAIERGRAVFSGSLPPKHDLEAIRERCVAGLPDTDDFTSPLCSDALDAMTMAAHILDIIINGDREAAGWVATLALDVADRRAQEEFVNDYSMITRELEDKIAAPETMKNEVSYLRELLAIVSAKQH